MSLLNNPRKRSVRRGWPIIGYVGPNGGGKSACMVWDTLPSLDSGRRVLSTVRLLDWRDPRPCDDVACEHPEHETGDPITHLAAHPMWEPLRDWQQLLDAEKCDVLMDEVTGVASSRESAGLPAPVANKLVQLRRADVVVRWSAPSWARADKIIRECSQAVVHCQGFLPKASGDTERMWRQRRLFKWATYDAADFEDFTSGKRERMSAEAVDFHWGPGSEVFGAYDTLDAVSVVGTVSDSGRCYRCGGRRSVPACSCEPRIRRGAGEEGPAKRDTGPAPGKRVLTVLQG